MKKVSLEYEQGHLFLSDNLGGYFIVDTGSPTTVYESQKLDFLGRLYDVSTSYSGLNVSSLRNFIPNTTKHIVGLLGNDILRDYDWLEFNVQEGVACFGNGEAPGRQNSFHFRDFMGVLMINIRVDGVNMRVILDSGAMLSYIKPSISNAWNSVGMKQDFHPLVGLFQTPHFIQSIELQGKVIDVNWGNLPAGLLSGLLSNGIVDAILGVDLFAQATVLLDYRNQIMAVN